MGNSKFISKCSLIVLLAPLLAVADNATPWVDVNGFVSARYSQSNDSVFYNNIKKNDGINEAGSFWGSKVGVNFHKAFTPNVVAVAQFVAAVQDDNDVLEPRLDWAFVALKLSKTFTLRLGKIKFPIGIVNEYIDVGLAYPWQQPPEVVYSLSGEGPLATREGFVGSSVLMENTFGDWTLGGDVFGGLVKMTGLTIKDMSGVTLRATYQDGFFFQASHYSGIVRADNPMSEIGLMMDKKSRSTSLIGTKIDWQDFIFYAEYARVNMNDLIMNFTTGGGGGAGGAGGVAGMGGVVGGVTKPVRSGNSTSWYASLAYRIDKWTPHVTHQHWLRTSSNGQDNNSVGLNYAYNSNVTLKATVSNIRARRNGLFGNYDSNTDTIVSTAPNNIPVKMWSVGFDMLW